MALLFTNYSSSQEVSTDRPDIVQAEWPYGEINIKYINGVIYVYIASVLNGPIDDYTTVVVECSLSPYYEESQIFFQESTIGNFYVQYDPVTHFPFVTSFGVDRNQVYHVRARAYKEIPD